MTDPSGNIIIHPGIVDHIEEGVVFVRILSQSACSTCHAKGACAVSEIEEKIVEVVNPGNRNYQPGEHVTVKMKQSLGRRAVMLGYIIPLIILVGSIVTLVLLLNNEGLAALLSILLLVPYYGLLYLSRNKLKQHFNFTIYPEN
jgi:sigma-E factor negative regulatory protein RseC